MRKEIGAFLCVAAVCLLGSQLFASEEVVYEYDVPTVQSYVAYTYDGRPVEVTDQEMAEEQRYSDEVAQEAFEAALAMGMPYESAWAAGQEALDSAEAHYEDMTVEKQAYADRISQQEFENALAMGATYEQALAAGQYALDMSEQHFEEEANQREAYADEMGQKQFEASLAAGASYQEAAAAGQYAMEEAEEHFNEVNDEKEKYADKVAEEEFEQALAMGLPYDVAVQQGQQALDAAEVDFEEEVNEKESYADAVAEAEFEKALRSMPYEKAVQRGQAAMETAERDYDQLTKEKHAQADRVAEQQFEAALAAGASYEQAVAAGQYALDMSEQNFNDRVMRGMQVPYMQEKMAMEQQMQMEETTYADEEDFAEANAEEQYHLAQLLGMPEEQAVAQGQYAYEASYDEYDAALEEATAYQAMEEQAAYERAAYEEAAAAYAHEQEQMAKKLRLTKMRETQQLKEMVAAEEKKLRGIKMREAEERRQRAKAEELEKMRRDVQYEAMMAEIKKPKFVPQQPAPVAATEKATHDSDFKKLMQEYREKKNAIIVDDGKKRETVVLTPPEDALELPEEEEDFVVTDDGMKTDTVVVSAAHHTVDAVKDSKGKVHTFTHEPMQNKINVPESEHSIVKPVVMGLGLALSTGALVMIVLRWKVDPPQDYSGDAPLIENAFGDEAMLATADVEAPPTVTWASSAVSRALDSVEPPSFK